MDNSLFEKTIQHLVKLELMNWIQIIPQRLNVVKFMEMTPMNIMKLIVNEQCVRSLVILNNVVLQIYTFSILTYL